MAKFPFTFDTRAIEIEAALREGRRADAKRIAIKYLRATPDDPFLKLVADLLEVKKSNRQGRKRNASPPFWFEIGSKFCELKERGDKKVRDQLAKAYGCSPSQISLTVKYYKKAILENDNQD